MADVPATAAPAAPPAAPAAVPAAAPAAALPRLHKGMTGEELQTYLQQYPAADAASAAKIFAHAKVEHLGGDALQRNPVERVLVSEPAFDDANLELDLRRLLERLGEALLQRLVVLAEPGQHVEEALVARRARDGRITTANVRRQPQGRERRCGQLQERHRLGLPFLST